MLAAAPQLLRRVTCPHCWEQFAPENILWISSHSDLLGDPRLGPEQPQRFLPTRFDVAGNALDAKGFVCQSLACPRCHLPLPRPMLETEPAFVSILGSPACGKSFYLAAATWELRKIFASGFAVSFTDIDTVSNRSLNEYEESLFLNPRPDELVPLADLIRKTELQGELYDTVSYGNQAVSYPRPFLFSVRPQENHPNGRLASRLARVLCLYDNAGEHFQAGQDTTSSPVTHHLARSRMLLFLFDPLQDQRFRKLCGVDAPGTRISRQETVLLEAAARVRRYTGLSHNAKHDRPLIVVLTKCDAWAHLLKGPVAREPWVQKDQLSILDTDEIEKRSGELRSLLLRVCPEIVSAAENFSQKVVYVPVSALGRSPEMHPTLKTLAIRPGQIRPVWATVPLLYGLSQWLPGMVLKGRRRPRTPADAGISSPDGPGGPRQGSASRQTS